MIVVAGERPATGETQRLGIGVRTRPRLGTAVTGSDVQALSIEHIFAFRHLGDSRRQRLGLGLVLRIGIAPLHDIIVLHAYDRGVVPPVRGCQLADVANPAAAEGRGHQLDDHAARPALRIGRKVHHQQIVRRDTHPVALRRGGDNVSRPRIGRRRIAGGQQGQGQERCGETQGGGAESGGCHGADANMAHRLAKPPSAVQAAGAYRGGWA